MEKNNQIFKPRSGLSLGDLILAVSSCTKSTKETVAAVADFLNAFEKASLQRAVPWKRRFFAYKTLSVLPRAFIFIQ
jgi:hypothetical protein